MLQKGFQKGRGDFHITLEKSAASIGVSQIGSTVSQHPGSERVRGGL